MKQFKLYGETIEFSDVQKLEIELFSELHQVIFSHIKENFEEKIVSYDLQQKKNETGDEEFDEINDDMFELFILSCVDLKGILADMLINTNPFGIKRSDLELSLMKAINQAFHDTYEPLMYEDCDIITQEEYIIRLQNDYFDRLSFIVNLSWCVSIQITLFLIEHMYNVAEVTMVSGTSADVFPSFDEDAYEPRYTLTATAAIRDDIEENGIDDRNKSRYISTILNDPYSMRVYFSLLYDLGDEQGELEKLFSFIFGSNEVYKELAYLIVCLRVDEVFPDFRQGVEEITDIHKLKAIGDSIADYGAYYNSEYSYILRDNIVARIETLEQQ